MTREPSSRRSGPSILAVDPWVSVNRSKGRMHQVLSNEERVQLATIASVVRSKRGAEIYRSGQQAGAMFDIISGVVKVYSGDDIDHITAFLFPGDLFGLSEEGTYTNSVEAVTPVMAYQLPTSALRGRLSKDAILEYHCNLQTVSGPSLLTTSCISCCPTPCRYEDSHIPANAGAAPSGEGRGCKRNSHSDEPVGYR